MIRHNRYVHYKACDLSNCVLISNKNYTQDNACNHTDAQVSNKAHVIELKFVILTSSKAVWEFLKGRSSVFLFPLGNVTNDTFKNFVKV